MSTEIWGVPSFFFVFFQPSLDLIHPIFLGPKLDGYLLLPIQGTLDQGHPPRGGKPGEACCISFVMAGEWGKGPGTWNIYTYIILDVSLHIDTLFFKKNNRSEKWPPLETKVIFQEPIFHFHDGRNIRFQYFSTVHSGDSRIMNHRTIGIWCKKTIQVVQADSVPCSPRSSPQTFLVSLVSLAFKFIRTGYQLLQGDWLHGFEVEPWILSRTMNHTEMRHIHV